MVPTIVTTISNFLKKKIQSGIKVRKKPIISFKNNSLRNREVYSQSKDLLKWKIKSRKYGNSNWIAKETVFSSIKRTHIVNIYLQ
jgi:nuclear transport factor 2 (NTF2) superfamily protein